MEAKIATLAQAKAVIFDVRGYPTDVGTNIVRHLLTAEQNAPWLYVAKITGPFGQFAGWQNIPFGLSAATPHLSGRTVFLTDGRAISAGEVLLGFVSDLKLGTIIGAPTAGTNGNLVDFALPGDFRMSFTGMRATRHDGKTSYHLIGIQPDIHVAPTLAGLRSGRDELLERALEVVRGKK